MQKPDLEKYLTEEMSNEQKGALHVNLALVYLQTLNNINERYLEMLKETTETLKRISKKIEKSA
ncbi:MAG: hypothetical protein AAB885_01990 [Patescibacteria group bacterium]